MVSELVLMVDKFVVSGNMVEGWIFVMVENRIVLSIRLILVLKILLKFCIWGRCRV